jgi:hypothetical protein
MLTCVLWLQKLPPSWGGLWCHHVSCSPRPCLPARVGSGATTCPTAPDPASLLVWASAPPHVLWPWTLPPCWGGLRCCHISYGPGTCFPAGVVSGATMCPATPDPASLLGWAPTSPRVMQPRTLLPFWGVLRCHHMSTVTMGCGPQE